MTKNPELITKICDSCVQALKNEQQLNSTESAKDRIQRARRTRAQSAMMEGGRTSVRESFILPESIKNDFDFQNVGKKT